MKREDGLKEINESTRRGEKVLALILGKGTNADYIRISEEQDWSQQIGLPHGSGCVGGFRLDNDLWLELVRDFAEQRHPDVLALDMDGEIRIFRSDTAPFKVPYRGMSYPPFLARWPFKWLWKRYCCPRDMHLFTEVFSPASPAQRASGHIEHSLSCAICGFQVEVANFHPPLEAQESFIVAG